MSDAEDVEDEITEIKATAADVARVLAAVRGIGESVDRTVLAATDSYRHLSDIEIAPAAAQRPEGSASASAKLDAVTVDTARRTAPCRWVVLELVEPVSGGMNAFGTIRT